MEAKASARWLTAMLEEELRGGANRIKEGAFAYRHHKLLQILCEAPISSNPPATPSDVQAVLRPGGGGGGDRLLARRHQRLLWAPFVCHWREGWKGVLQVNWGGGGGGGAAIGAFSLIFSPLFLTDAPPVHSVSQDDFHKASHVGFFGLVGGEEGMLLRWKQTLD